MKKAFTLVELLIVIIIIGILATMAIPQYQKMVEKSREGQAYVKMDLLLKAELVYYVQFGDWLDIDAIYNEPEPSFTNKMSALSLESADFKQDKYFQYGWGTGIYTTLDGKTHLPGASAAIRVDSSGNRIGHSLFLFNDDQSVWKAEINQSGNAVDHFIERIR